MAGDSGSLLDIQKLNGTNYDDWAYRVKNALKYKKLWKCVNNEKVEDEENDDQALSIISLACNNIVKDAIVDCQTAREAWLKLESKYIRSTPAAKVALYCRLTNLRCQSVDEAKELLEEFAIVVRKLRELKVTMDDDMYSIILLRALPSSFEQFRVAIMTRDELPSLEDVQSKVEEELLRQTSNYMDKSNNNPTEERAMIVRTNSSRTCFECGQSGHFKRDCPQGRGNRHSQSNNHNHNRNANRWNGHRNNNNYNIERMAMYASTLSVTNNKPNEQFIIDSGCTSHICNNRKLFTEFRPHHESIKLADGSVIKCEFIGDIEIQGEKYILELKNVLYVPSFNASFISVNRSIAEGCKFVFHSEGVDILKGDQHIANGFLKNELFLLRTTDTPRTNNVNNINSAGQKLSLMDWHRKLGHVNTESISKMCKSELVDGLNVSSFKKLDCEVCARCKITEESYPKSTDNRSGELIYRIHSDVCEMPVHSFSGAKYFVTFIDDYSRYVKVFCLKSKSEVIVAWRQYKNLVERQTGLKIKVLRSDNGGEYMGGEFGKELSSAGIRHETSVPRSPQQNGVAERMNRTIEEMVRCMMLDGEMPAAAWAEAVNTAVYVRNRVESSVVGATPFERMYGRKPQMGHIQRFGAKVVALKKGHNNKLTPKGDTWRLCGYAPTQKGYRLLCPRTGRMIVSRDCRFVGEQRGELILSPDADEESVVEEKVPEVIRREQLPRACKKPNLMMPVKKSDSVECAEEEISQPPVFKVGEGVSIQEPANFNEASSGPWSKWW